MQNTLQTSNNTDIYGIIYMYRNKKNGKVYVGQTTQPLYKRRSEHKRAAATGKDNMIFHHAIQKYGFNSFKETVLGQASSLEELNKMEQLFIKEYNSNDKTIGYNSMDGGSHGKHSEETRAKISEATKKLWQNPEYRAMMSKNGKAQYSNINTTESRKKNGLMQRGKTINDAQKLGLLIGKEACKRQVLRTNKSTGEKTIYLSCREAAVYNNVTPQCIYYVLNRFSKTVLSDYKWSYA